MGGRPDVGRMSGAGSLVALGGSVVGGPAVAVAGAAEAVGSVVSPAGVPVLGGAVGAVIADAAGVVPSQSGMAAGVPERVPAVGGSPPMAE